jgi:hypothetical protein
MLGGSSANRNSHGSLVTANALSRGMPVPLYDWEMDVFERPPDYPVILTSDGRYVKIAETPFRGIKPIHLCSAEDIARLYSSETDFAKDRAAQIGALKGFLASFAAYNAKELLGAPEGCYTWLLYSRNGESDIEFIAKRATSLWELGSRHIEEACDPRYGILPHGRVLGGGELTKQADGISFNLLSGTFTKMLMKKAASPEAMKELSDFIEGKFRDQFSGAAVHFLGPTVSEIMDKRQLQSLLKPPAVYKIPTEEIERCKAFGISIVLSSKEDYDKDELMRIAGAAKAPPPIERTRGKRRPSSNIYEIREGPDDMLGASPSVKRSGGLFGASPLAKRSGGLFGNAGGAERAEGAVAATPTRKRRRRKSLKRTRRNYRRN